MNVGQLRNVLKAAEAHYRRDGKREVADALSVFAANLLQGDDSKTVSAFVREIEKARKPPTPRAPRSPRRKR
jgi:hypothetical protein